MKICYDSLEEIYLTRNKTFRKGSMIYVEKESCLECGDFYLTEKSRSSQYCSKRCCRLGENHHMYGKTFSEDVRKNMSNGHKGSNNNFYGRRHSEESKRKMSVSSKGKNAGIEHYLYGKKISKETRMKMCQSHADFSGKNNPMYGNRGLLSPGWKGGVSKEPYCVDWTKEYKSYIKERDGNMCLNPVCYRSFNKLFVHHIDYNKKNCEPFNLITLCNSCNSRANKDREWHISWYRTIMNNRYNYKYGNMR